MSIGVWQMVSDLDSLYNAVQRLENALSETKAFQVGASSLRSWHLNLQWPSCPFPEPYICITVAPFTPLITPQTPLKAPVPAYLDSMCCASHVCMTGAAQGRGAVDDERAAVAGRGRVQAQRTVRDATSLPRRQDRCVGHSHENERDRGVSRDVCSARCLS